VIQLFGVPNATYAVALPDGAMGAGITVFERKATNSWSSVLSPPSTRSASLGGTAANALYVVGSLSDNTTYVGSAVAGGSFVFETPPASTPALTGVWALTSMWGPGDVIAVGGAGTILRREGTNWVSEPSGTNAQLNAVWGAVDELYAVGDGNVVLHRW
jgi:hypothetical protein